MSSHTVGIQSAFDGRSSIVAVQEEQPGDNSEADECAKQLIICESMKSR